MKRPFFSAVVLLTALVFAGYGPAGALAVQVAPASAATAAREKQAASHSRSGANLARHSLPRDFLTPKTARTGNLAAAEDEDDRAVFRHSPVVRAVGRMLHLDPERAARTFEYFNFSLLVGAGLFFLVTRFPGVLRAHRASIQKRLLEAREATEKANARLSAVEERFARLDQEVAGIRAQAEQEGAAEEARIKALIETERQRIVASAEQEIAAAAASARRDLKRFAGELAVDRAARAIALTGEDDQALVRRFSREVGRGVQNGERN